MRINGELCALIRPTRGADVDDWTTQLNTFPASRLHNGDNSMAITAAELTEPTRRNVFDDFEVGDIVVWFKQEA